MRCVASRRAARPLLVRWAAGLGNPSWSLRGVVLGPYSGADILNWRRCLVLFFLNSVFIKRFDYSLADALTLITLAATMEQRRFSFLAAYN